MKKFSTIALLFVLSTFFVNAQETNSQKKRKPRKPNPAMAKIVDDQKLPRVLLIGDSISIGYTQAVRNALAKEVNVHRPLTNCGPTIKGIAELTKWLEVGGKGKKWDVIHFNWGLHDLKYMGPNGENLADPKAKDSSQQVPPEAYQKNLAQLVESLQATGATLIWRNTTPVPVGARGRVVGDSAKYNELAATVMKKHSVKIHDLYSFVVAETKKDPRFSRKGDVHFPPKSSQAMAEEIAGKIRDALKERK